MQNNERIGLGILWILCRFYSRIRKRFNETLCVTIENQEEWIQLLNTGKNTTEKEQEEAIKERNETTVKLRRNNLKNKVEGKTRYNR